MGAGGLRALGVVWLALLASVAGCGPGGGIRIEVVEGPAPLTPLVGARVRADGADGTVVEAVTDDLGVVTIENPNGTAWTITVAEPGHSVVSLLGVTSSPVVPIRLERLSGLDPGDTYPVSGTITGASRRVQVDCNDFDTLPAVGSGPWSSMFYVSDATADTPLHCVALEIDVSGDVVNMAEVSVPRTRAPITNLNFDFPIPAVTPVTTTYRINTPMSGLASGCTNAIYTAVQQNSGPEEQQYVLVGTTDAMIGSPVNYTLRHFGGTAAPNFAWLTLQCPESIINMALRDFGGERNVTVGQVDSIAISGGTLADLSVTSSAMGYDYLVVHIGESDTDLPRWRVIAPYVAGSATATVPRLPMGITTDMIALGGPIRTSVIGIAVRTGSTPVYGAPASNRATLQNHIAVGGMYGSISTSGR